jgi:hypothetical protein
MKDVETFVELPVSLRCRTPRPSADITELLPRMRIRRPAKVGDSLVAGNGNDQSSTICFAHRERAGP